MGSVRKASAWLGLVEDSDDERYYDDDYAEAV
ncbi:cell division protein SepF, partial [Streptomyces sp. NPDC048551]